MLVTLGKSTKCLLISSAPHLSKRKIDIHSEIKTELSQEMKLEIHSRDKISMWGPVAQSISSKDSVSLLATLPLQRKTLSLSHKYVKKKGQLSKTELYLQILE